MKHSLLALTAFAAVALSACGGGGGAVAEAPPAPSSALKVLDEGKVLSTALAKDWLVTKDQLNPAYAGSKKYDQYINFLEKEMRGMGMVDFTRYTFPYPYWETSEWPDKSGWSLTSDGAAVELASYATNSGNTGAAGVTGTMILYDMNVPAAQRPTAAQMKGKIVVFKQQLYSSVTTGNGLNDYQFRTDPETFPIAPGTPIPASVDANYRNRAQLSNATALGANVCAAAGGLAAIWVLDMSPLAAQGARQHGTPNQYNCPGVLVDRVAGAKVLADATAGKTAKVMLNSTITNTRPAQLVAYLPGKNYGKPDDQKLLLITHTEGMSLVEDNGSLGILGVVKYFSQLPQAERTRTIMVYLDNRHFVAGTENAYPYEYFDDFADAANGLVGGLAMEHFGGMQFNEVGNEYKATGWPAHTNLYSFPNTLALETMINAAKEVKIRRGQVSTPTATGLGSVYSDTGVNGLAQGGWLGPGFMAPFVDNGRLPAFHVSGDWPSSGYQNWTPAVGVRVDPDYFRVMVRMSIRLMQTLMTEDLTKLAPDWGIVRANLKALAATDFQTGVDATVTKAALLAQFDQIFDKNVRTGDYAAAKAALPDFRSKLAAALNAGTATTNRLANVDRVIALATKGANVPN